MTDRAAFHYTKSIAPMMWVLFVLSLIELIVVHIFVALRWPMIGWPLTILSALGAIWLVVWIRSFKRYPHELSDDQLHLKFGNLKSIDVSLSNIAQIRRGWEQGALDKKGVVNFAGIAYPNRCIELHEPLEKGRSRLFIRLDEPEAFDESLATKDVEFI